MHPNELEVRPPAFSCAERSVKVAGLLEGPVQLMACGGGSGAGGDPACSAALFGEDDALGEGGILRKGAAEFGRVVALAGAVQEQDVARVGVDRGAGDLLDGVEGLLI